MLENVGSNPGGRAERLDRVQPFKGVALDLDGTLLRDDRTIHPETSRALTEAGDSLHVLLISARSPRSVRDYAAEIGQKGGFFTLNGALGIGRDRRQLFSTAIPRPRLQAVLELCDRVTGLVWSVYHGFSWQVPRIDDRIRAEMEIVGFEPDKITPRGDVGEAEKVLICGDDALLAEFCQRLLAEEPSLVATMSKPGYLEVTASGVSKAAGLDEYARLVGLRVDDFAAIGDDMNDIDMFNIAGIGVAMGNAPQAARESADLVIGSNESPAVAEFIRAICKVKS
jgi:Cof subfamily protein (haloacid dehalogenase superfamily)